MGPGCANRAGVMPGQGWGARRLRPQAARPLRPGLSGPIRAPVAPGGQVCGVAFLPLNTCATLAPARPNLTDNTLGPASVGGLSDPKEDPLAVKGWSGSEDPPKEPPSPQPPPTCPGNSQAPARTSSPGTQ